MRNIRLFILFMFVVSLSPNVSLSGSTKVSDKWLNCKIALIPVCFADLKPILTMNQVVNAFKSLEYPDSMASFVNTLSDGKFKIDFGSFAPGKWLALKKKRMDYWVERSKYNWEILTKDFIDDTLSLAKSNGLNLDEYDNDKNGLPDYYIGSR